MRILNMTITLALLCAVSVHAQTRSDRGPDRESVLRIPRNDRLTPGHLRRAVAGSPTMRELVRRLEGLQDTVLYLRAHPRLAQDEGLLGRGRFWVVRGVLYGLLEYHAEPLGERRALRMISHELAHALEVGLAPRGVDTASLRPFVLARGRDEEASVEGVETEFARGVGYRVHLELLGRLRGPSALSAVADGAHLALGPAPAARGPDWIGQPYP